MRLYFLGLIPLILAIAIMAYLEIEEKGWENFLSKIAGFLWLILIIFGFILFMTGLVADLS